jgi:hypothetical protein|tara:strand:+ start:1998 stop:2390 length:393 start_codon:yes stop_codon:yes gene_type:complete
MNILSPNSWLKTLNGSVYYSYSSPKGAGSVNETIIDIENVGLDDMFIKLIYTVDWAAIQVSSGFSVSLDGVDMLFQNGDVQTGVKLASPWHIEFVAPAQTHLKVNAHCDAASTAAFRSVMLVGYPLQVVV